MSDHQSRLNRRKPKRRLKRWVKLCLACLSIALFLLVLNNFIHSQTTKTKSDKSANVAYKKNPPIKKIPSDTKNDQAVIDNPVDINTSPVIDQYLKGLHFNGTVLVVKNQKIVMNQGYGYADMEKKIPNNSQTVFFIGSITKVFISTAVMQLQERGMLNIHDYLAKYIPDFPSANKITLYNLLTHTSGIPEHKETADRITHDQLMKKIELGHIQFAPGTNWAYSDSNYSILAYIIEKVTGEPLDQYVKENIFAKAGLTHTGFGDDYYKERFQSKGYKIKNNVMVSPTLPDMSQLFGCGDIYTTPYDMYLFDQSLYTGKLLSKESLKQFFTPFKHHYALGMYSDPGSYSDHGVLPGWNTLNSFSKMGTKYVILLSNVQNGVKSLGVVNNQLYFLLNK